ncbi:MAG: cupin domain-containing protein [Acidimicrobiia bacterium]
MGTTTAATSDTATSGAATSTATAAATAPPKITRSEELPWLGDEHGAGVRVLALNPEAGWFTMLIKGRAGQVNPPHTHIGGASFYVLSGGFDYRGGSAREGDWVWEPAGSVHDATTHPVDTVYFGQIYGPVAFHNKEGRPPRMVDWLSTQRLVDRAAGGGPSHSGYDPLDAALVRTGEAPWCDLAPGWRVQVLRSCADTGHVHLLVRADAGSEVPARIHFGGAELFVLDGRLEVDGEVLATGDHLLEPVGARRGPLRAAVASTYLLSLYGAVAYLDGSGAVTEVFDHGRAEAMAAPAQAG